VSAPTLICAAMPFGYGPAAKLLTLAEALKARGLRLTLVGRGIALELASRAGHLFGEVLPGEPSARAQTAVASSAGVLSVMDRDVAAAATAAAVPLYVVDSLLWMRDAIPPAFREARRYWAQDFPGLRDVQGDFEPKPAIVGPIVSRPLARRAAAQEGLVINLGGAETPEGADATAARYADFVVQGFLDSALAARFAGRATVMAGSHAIEVLEARHRDRGLGLASLPHAQALERLARASLVLTSPGLTTTLESFQCGVPTYFLPPQNYSQWCTLRRLRAADVAPHALHWEDLPGSPRLRDRMPEAERAPLVRVALGRFTANGDARACFSRQLGAIGEADHEELIGRQRRFFDALGPDGGVTIADELAVDLLTTARA